MIIRQTKATKARATTRPTINTRNRYQLTPSTFRIANIWALVLLLLPLQSTILLLLPLQQLPLLSSSSVVVSALPTPNSGSNPLTIRDNRSGRSNKDYWELVSDHGYSDTAKLLFGGEAETTTTTNDDTDDDGNDDGTASDVPIKSNNENGLKRNYHIKASILTLLLTIVWVLPALAFSPQPIPDTLNQSLTTLRTFTSLFYLLECALCSTRRYLTNTLTPSSFTNYTQTLIQSTPVIEWSLECYHYRSVPAGYGRRRRVGGRRRRNRHIGPHREKVVTFRSRRSFVVNRWSDVTPPPPSPLLDVLTRRRQPQTRQQTRSSLDGMFPTTTQPFIKTTLTKRFLFMNPAVQMRFANEEQQFLKEESWRDTHYKLTRVIRLPDFKQKVMVVRTGLSDVVLASKFWFWVFSLMGLTVPYRVWLGWRCCEAGLEVTKVVEE